MSVRPPARLNSKMRSGSVATQNQPLARMTPRHGAGQDRAYPAGVEGSRARQTNDAMPYSSVSGTWSVKPFSSWTQSGRVRAFSKSKRPVSKTLVSGTSQKSVSISRAPGLRLRMMRRASA